ncbi:WXG100 family type VII secretion target [Nonomuraea lactucae]|uniref:WXG100 family type VII secretion target n=1 Tax=Nonomuraea lactucae TaxID=2249762 RepID=UPI000DE54C5E|nr:hypothetical protein [Nonomuraea lactucae]
MADSTKKTHWIKTSCGNFDVDDDGRSVAEVKDFITSLDPVGVETAATAYIDASTKLAATLDVIDEVSGELAKIWEGEASVEAQKALRLLHDTIINLSTGLDHMGKPLETLGAKIREHKDFVENGTATWSNPIGDPGSWDDSMPGYFRTIDKGWEWGSQDELAGQHLRALTKDLYESHVRFPDYVQKELPNIQDSTVPGPDTTKVDTPHIPRVNPASYNGDLSGIGSGQNGLNRSGYPDGSDFGRTGLDGTNDPRFPDGTRDPDQLRLPGDQNGPGDPTNQGTGRPDQNGQPGVSSTNPKFPDNPNGTHLNGTDPRSTNLSDYTPPKIDNSPNSPFSPTSTNPSTSYAPNSSPISGTGPGTGLGHGLTAGDAAALRAANGANGTGGMGMPMLPLGATGTGGEERTNETSTWLKEEDDVWVGKLENVVDGQIG